jgi:hypothetical protein
VTPTGLEAGHVSINPSKDLRKSTVLSAAQSGAFSADFGATSGAANSLVDPDLALIMAYWPVLSAKTKAAILSMISGSG